MPLVGFEPMIPASARAQTHALDRAATGIGCAHSSGVKSNQIILSVIKIVFPAFFRKEMCLPNAWKSPAEPQGSTVESCSTTALKLWVWC
jgi:hypothetical protein